MYCLLCRLGPEPFALTWSTICRLLDGLELPAEFPVPQQCPEGLPELQRSPRERDFPVYVMLPLDTVWLADREGQKVSVIKREQALNVGLQMLKKAGVEGVMIDVWWGIVEHAGPQQYDFSAYQRLFATAAQAGLKIQAVMSFHAAGGNVGDTCKISLPKWISDIGVSNPDIFYTDKHGYRNKECLSLGCDSEPLFWGRTPVDMYRDFISAFADTFDDLAGRLRQYLPGPPHEACSGLNVAFHNGQCISTLHFSVGMPMHLSLFCHAT